MITARLDGFTTTGGRSLAFSNPERIIIAHRTGDVIEALSEAEAVAASGRWVVGYIAYDAAPAFDPRIETRPESVDDALPLVWFGVFADRTEPPPFVGHARLGPSPYTVSAWTPSMNEDRYRSTVDAVRARIATGELNQVNFALRLTAALRGDLTELYRDVVLAQRGEYGAYLDLGRHRILSASPERFFKITGSAINIRPMKGAVGRGRWVAEDRDNAGRLLTSDRDREEHLRIVAQMRAELETITRPGSVVTNRSLDLERFETVWQLVSDVSGDLAGGAGVVDAFRALFPSAAVTGDPKVAAMEAIRRHESGSRGIYGGAIGYLSPGPDGRVNASFNVAIRTIVIDTEEGIGEYRVGAGITEQIALRGEYDEALAKARILTQRRPEASVYEEIRWDPDHGFRWIDRHLHRLAGSAAYFGFRHDPVAVRSVLDEAVASATAPCAVRIEVDRFGEVNAFVEETPVPEARWWPNEDSEPVIVEFDPDPVSSSSVYRFHNTTARHAYLERGDTHGPESEVLLVNERGEVTEGTRHNVAVRISGTWLTPPLASGCLPGVLRGALLDESILVEEILHPDDLFGAEGIALLDSVRGWRPARLSGG